MKLYGQLAPVDVINPVIGLFVKGSYRLFPDGKIRSIFPITEDTDSPWLNQKGDSVRNCELWTLYFTQYRFISRNCMNCWKIVARPQTLKELMKFYEYQLEYAKEEDAIACKCGMERREEGGYKGLYAAFWYTPHGCSLSEAKEWQKKIDLKIKKNLGFQFSTSLKRGCTEMEDRGGPSELWRYPDIYHVTEDALDAVWEIPIVDLVNSSPMRTAVLRKWIGWAFSHKDPTVHEYYNNIEEFGITPTTTYHDTLVHVEQIPETSKQRREKNVGSDTSEIQRLPSD